MIRKIAVLAAVLGMAGASIGQAKAVTVPARHAEAHNVIGPWAVGWIVIEGTAQEAPSATSGWSTIATQCAATLYSISETQYRSINQCTLRDTTSGAVYHLSTVTAQPNVMAAEGVFTVPSSHNYEICPQAEFDENSGNLIVSPWYCAPLVLTT